ncbi:MAG TPA: proton-conducting transporter membrane subunit, partial [Phenylobacterium sp.]|nr:proton-conducting transporter membrane subunit [Phenylobacterium sp.]
MAEAALSIALPFLMCLLAVPLGRRAAGLIWMAAPVALALAGRLVWRVLADGPGVHAPGGWGAPLGIELRVDGLAAAFVLASALVCAGAGLFARSYLAAATETRKGFAFWPLFYACWAAVNAVFLGGDLFNLYVALELLTVAAVAMVALEGKAPQLAAATRYLLFALLGSLAFLAGVVLIYGAHGMMDIARLRSVLEPGPAVLLALLLMSVGLMAKAALFPLQGWLPDAHGGAPAPASALLSALVVKAALYILLRIWFDLAPEVAGPRLMTGLGLLGALGVAYASVQALRQTRLKRIVAYSTIAQLSYLMLVFPLAGGAEPRAWAEAAWSGAMLQALAHALAKAAMFLAAGVMVLAAGDDRLDHMAGVSRQAPMAGFAFALAAVSLMGLPPGGGFLAKYLMLTAAFDSGGWLWAAVLLAGGLASAAYLFRPLTRLMTARGEEAPPLSPTPRSLQWPPLILALAALALGLVPGAYELLQAGAPLPEARP